MDRVRSQPWVRDSVLSVRRHPAPILAFAALALAFAACYRKTFSSLAAEWSSSDTYSHGFIVPWVAVALAWMRRDRIRSVRPAPNFILGSGLVLLALAAKMAGFAAGATVLEGASLLPLLAGLVVLTGGIELLGVLLLPLFYLLFMIPVWAPFVERLTPPFRHFSAWMGVHLAGLLGVPAVLEGFYIHLPQTTLRVAEACSGVNYLIAVTAVGIPLAWFTFPDAGRRIALLALGVVIAILANGLRVSLIVILLYGGLIRDTHGPGHMLQGLSVALVGYGGLFLGAWALSRFGPRPRERKGSAGPAIPGPPRPRSPWRWTATAAVLAGALAGVFGWQARSRITPVPLMVPLTAIPTRVGVWQATEGALPPIPVVEIPGSDRLERVYWSPSGSRVSLLVLYVQDQSGPRELVGYRTAALLRDGTALALNPRSGPVKVRRSDEREDGAVVVTIAWYDIDGHVTDSAWEAKVRTAWNVLTRHRSNAALVAARARFAPGEASAREREMLPLIEGMVDGLRATLPGSGAVP